MYSEEFYRVALLGLEGFGMATMKKMLRLSGSATNVFTKSDLWMGQVRRRSKGVPLPRVSDALRREVDEELRLMEKHGIRQCFYLDKDYPYRLKNCSDGPIAFYYLGAADFNGPRTLAVVGTREATEYGRSVVRKLLSELRDAGVVTVSGLAYGIDTETHARSIEYGLRTIAVMGNGLGTVYPSQNRPLARQIIEQGGTLVSEYPFRTQPDRLNFPRRNRIVAGMADAVVVAETANKGGSIITAHIAQSYNRDVFAFPGSVFDPHFEGCHSLIRQNVAALVTSGQDLLEMMNWESSQGSVQTSLFVDLTDDEQQVVDLVRASGELAIDRLSEALSEYSPSKLAGLLLTLELKGVLVCRPGKVYKLQN